MAPFVFPVLVVCCGFQSSFLVDNYTRPTCGTGCHHELNMVYRNLKIDMTRFVPLSTFIVSRFGASTTITLLIYITRALAVICVVLCCVVLCCVVPCCAVLCYARM